MSKFKVGDKVKIREDLIYDYYYGNVRCGTLKLELRGKIGKITKIAKTGSYFVHNHWFSEEMLETCDSKNTSKFKVGDIIRCIKYKDEIVNESLRKAEIIDDTPYFKIKILEHDEPMRVNYRVECIFANLNFDDYFEYFDEEKEEEENMNKVVDLWYSRKKENIYKKYRDLEDEYFKEHYEIVKQYNQLIENFEKDLEEFYTRYRDISINDDFVIFENADFNTYKYAIDKTVILNDAKITYKEDKNKEYKELQLKYEDINALLSMSDDLEYQQSILIEYGIIDKKTKRMINESNFD